MNKGLRSTFSSAGESPGFLLYKASNLLLRLHGAALKEFDLTPAQFSLLAGVVYLSAEGPLTQSALAKHTGLDKMFVSDLIKALRKKSLVRTLPSSQDARAKLVEPTAAGVRRANAAINEVERIDARFFGKVSSRERVVRDLRALLDTSDDSGH